MATGYKPFDTTYYLNSEGTIEAINDTYCDRLKPGGRGKKTGKSSNSIYKGYTKKNKDILDKHSSSCIKKNGVLHNACIKSALRAIKSKKGGQITEYTLKKYLSVDDQENITTLLTELQSYCDIISKTQINPEDDMKEYIKNNTGIIGTNKSKFRELRAYIDKYKTPVQRYFTLSMRPLYDYYSLEKLHEGKIIETQEPDGTTISRDVSLLHTSYNCYKYNEDIVVGYEYDYYRNFINNAKFIKTQQIFIDKLSVAEKRTIQDYTKINTAFEFYIQYKYNKPEFNTFRSFSDSFFKQIYEYDNKKFKKCYISHFIDKLYDNSKAKQSDISIEKIEGYSAKEAFELWENENRDINGLKLPKSSDFPTAVPGKHEGLSIFKDILNVEEWKIILQNFIKDITLIILRTDALIDNICGYRGVAAHYIHDTMADKIREEYFKQVIIGNPAKDKFAVPRSAFEDTVNNIHAMTSDRFSSVSFDFNISHGFYSKVENSSTKGMYQTTINKGCKVLFIGQLSCFPDEFEVLIPPYHTCLYSVFETNNVVKKIDNCIHNKYSLCIPEKFLSYKIQITHTPQTADEFDTYTREGVDIHSCHGVIDEHTTLSKMVSNLSRAITAAKFVVKNNNAKKREIIREAEEKLKSFFTNESIDTNTKIDRLRRGTFGDDELLTTAIELSIPSPSLRKQGIAFSDVDMINVIKQENELIKALLSYDESALKDFYDISDLKVINKHDSERRIKQQMFEYIKDTGTFKINDDSYLFPELNSLAASDETEFLKIDTNGTIETQNISDKVLGEMMGFVGTITNIFTQPLG